MPRIVGRIGAAALFSSVASFSWADVTPEEVWQDWKDYSARFGQTVETGSETRTGETLTVGDIRMTMEMSDGSKFSSQLGDLDLRQLGDGSVAIDMGVSQVMSIAIEMSGEPPIEMDLVFDQEGLEVIASGNPGEISYDLRGKRLTVSSDSVTEGGETFPLSLMLSMSKIAGSYNLSGKGEAIQSELSAAELAVDLSMSDPDGGEGELLLNATLQDVVSSSIGIVPAQIATGDLAAMLAAGFSSEGTFTHNGSQFSFSFEDGSENAFIEGSSGAGALDFAMTEKMMRYGGSNRDVSFQMSGSDIPVPVVAMSMQESAFATQMPIGASEEPEDFSMLLRLVGLEINEGVWGLFDPGQQLPRDPATLVLDITGKGNLFFDMFDPEQAAMMGDEVPGELHEMTLNDLTLSLAGLRLNGMGGFTFDNEDLVTFDGMPAPSGSANFRLEGLNAFLDTLVGMGLMPEDQAMGTRMMLGMFAAPGETEDTLVSVIEVTEEGAVMANGQRLR
ncbi:MAG: DUF2125 domain-containing protein [Rhodobacteraceae bacterium]|nr:DUF2125 domain-containing protein [Paracoccaceae bacterium]